MASMVLAPATSLAASQLELSVLSQTRWVSPKLHTNAPHFAERYLCDVQVVGDFAFVADRASGLIVANIRDPTNIVYVGGVSNVWALGVSVVGKYAYVPGSEFAFGPGFYIIDVRDPTNCVVAGTVRSQGGAVDIKVAGSFAYLAEYYGGLGVYHLTNSTNGGRVGFAYSYGARAVDVVDAHAYVVDAVRGGLWIFNVSNPTNVTEVGGCPMNWDFDIDHGALGIQVVGRYAFAAMGSLGLGIFDVSDPTNCTHIGGYVTTPLQAKDVQVVGQYAFLAVYPDGVHIFDVSNPTNPVRVWRSGRGYSMEPEGVWVTPNALYVANSTIGLDVFYSIPRMQVTLLIRGGNPGSYTIERSLDLNVGTGWQEIATINAATALFYFTDFDISRSQKFYRARQP